MASANSYDLGRGPMLVEGFVFDVGKTDIAHLLRQGHLGGEVASLSMCTGNPDGGQAVEGSLVYVPCSELSNRCQGVDQGPVFETAVDRQRRRRWRTRSSPMDWSGRSELMSGWASALDRQQRVTGS